MSIFCWPIHFIPVKALPHQSKEMKYIVTLFSSHQAQPTTDSCSSAHLFFKDLYSAPCGFSASSGFSAGILFLVQCFFSWCVIDMFSASDCQVCQFESASSLCCVFVLVVVVCTSRQATINFWREKNKYSKCIRSRGAAFGSCWDPLKAHLWV